jgi:hypothetical protein
MKELSRNEMAAVKRINSTTKKLYDKYLKLQAKIAELQVECRHINNEIELWEAPIRKMTGGFTSSEVLDGSWLLPVDNIEDLEAVFEDALEDEVADLANEVHA